MVGQEKFEYGAEMMVAVSEDDESLHDEYLKLFSVAVSECDAGNPDVLVAMNEFGLQAKDLASARSLSGELCDLYIREYNSGKL